MPRPRRLATERNGCTSSASPSRRVIISNGGSATAPRNCEEIALRESAATSRLRRVPPGRPRETSIDSEAAARTRRRAQAPVFSFGHHDLDVPMLSTSSSTRAEMKIRPAMRSRACAALFLRRRAMEAARSSSSMFDVFSRRARPTERSAPTFCHRWPMSTCQATSETITQLSRRRPGIARL